MKDTYEAFERLRERIDQEGRELADDMLDVVEDSLARYGIIGDVGLALIADLRERLGIPDDIGGDED